MFYNFFVGDHPLLLSLSSEGREELEYFHYRLQLNDVTFGVRHSVPHLYLLPQL